MIETTKRTDETKQSMCGDKMEILQKTKLIKKNVRKFIQFIRQNNVESIRKKEI